MLLSLLKDEFATKLFVRFYCINLLSFLRFKNVDRLLMVQYSINSSNLISNKFLGNSLFNKLKIKLE